MQSTSESVNASKSVGIMKSVFQRIAAAMSVAVVPTTSERVSAPKSSNIVPTTLEHVPAPKNGTIVPTTSERVSALKTMAVVPTTTSQSVSAPKTTNVMPSISDHVAPPVLRPQSSVHLLAGATGGVVTTIITSPLDVVRTRMQSGFYGFTSKPTLSIPKPVPTGARAATRVASLIPFTGMTQTFSLLGAIKRQEGWGGLYRGLGPCLMGVVPATAIKFYSYGNCKRLGAQLTGYEENHPLVLAQAAVVAGATSTTVTCPLWLIKTRMQLNKPDANGVRQYKGSIDCASQIIKKEGVRGLYRGLCAGYLGIGETVVHLVLYERMKGVLAAAGSGKNEESQKNTVSDELTKWATTSGAAGAAKMASVFMTYPHEVVRTRLQAPKDGVIYKGLSDCALQIIKREGWRGLYGGLTPHMVRSVPSAAIGLGVYEFMVRILS